jgi:imidazole glycerol-phosphate synthase subunit HisH
MKIAVIDYNAGNVQSVLFALERLGCDALLTSDPEWIAAADKIIFPGQGEASSAMRSLRARNLDKLIPTLKQPFLGVCIGMQLLCTHSEENDTPLLGVISQPVLKFPTTNQKVPQMGWNKIAIDSGQWTMNNTVTPKRDEAEGIKGGSVLSQDIDNQWFYFVHSYYVEQGEYTTATADYGCTFSACLRKDNFHAAQFHPEKSSWAGEKLLKNFLDM